MNDISKPRAITKPITQPHKPKRLPESQVRPTPRRPTPKPLADKTETKLATSAIIKPLPRSRIVTTSSLASGLLAALITIKSYLVIHISRATTPGGFFHYLATRSIGSKLLLVELAPAAIIAVLAIATIWLWLRASAIYTASKLYDHRPVSPSVASRVGLNALSTLIVLATLGLVLALVWLGGLVATIKSIGELSLGSGSVAAIGVAVSLGMVLIGLWLVTGLTLAGYTIILSGQSFIWSLKAGFNMARRRYTAAAVTALGLLLTLGIVISIVVAGLVGLSQSSFHLSPWMIASVGALLSAGLLGWYAQFSLSRWISCYRLSVVQVYGDKTTLYLAGRHPKPISRAGIVVSLVWWLAVAVLGGVLLRHLQLDPSGLLNRLSTSIY